MTQYRTRFAIVLALVLALIAGVLVGNSQRPKVVPRFKVNPHARVVGVMSPVDNLACNSIDNITKAKATWYASGGGLDNATARAGQANANTDDENLVYELSRAEVGMIHMATSCEDDAWLQSIGEAWTGVLASRRHYQPPLGVQFDTWLIHTDTGDLTTVYSTGENFAYMYVMLWNMATILDWIARISPGSRSTWQNSFVSRWAPVLKVHYDHQMYTSTWAYSANWAGPCEGPHNIATYGTSTTGKEQQLVRMAAFDWGKNDGTEDKPGCNHIRDAESFIHSGFAEFTAAHLADPTNIPGGTSMTDTNMKKLISLYNAYLRAQSTTDSVIDLAGHSITGRYLHPDTYEFKLNTVTGNYQGLLGENGWAGDEDASRPPSDPPCTPGRALPTPPVHLGEDLSHTWTHFFTLTAQRALNNVTGITDQITDSDMREYAAQFAYKMANKDTSFPMFTNYTSGANGWYRAAYNGTYDGYPPWESGTMGAVLGWFWWGTFNADVVTYANRWKQIFEATSGTDYDWRVAHLQPGGGKWSGCVYNASATLNLNTNNAYGPGMFYPSIVPYNATLGGGTTTTTTTSTTTTTTTPPATNDACPGSTTCLFSANPTPTGQAFDSNPIEVGVKVSSSVAGQITAIRYYRFGGDSSTVTARLFDSIGSIVATGTSSVTTQGWRNITLTTPFTVTPGAVYTATIDSPTGTYNYTYDVFTSAAVTSGVLTSPQTATSPNGNGVYGVPNALPLSTYRGTSYSVDVAFSTTVPPTGRTITLTSFADTNLNGVQDNGEGPLARVKWAIYDASLQVIAKGTFNSTGTATATNVVAAAGQVIKFQPLAGVTARTPLTVNVPPSGAFAASFGSCCVLHS